MRKLVIALPLLLAGCGFLGFAPFGIAVEQDLRGTTALQQGWELACDGLGGAYTVKPGEMPSCDRGPFDWLIELVEGAL